MRVRLLYFAVLRDVCGKDGEDLALAEGTTPRDVWRLLRDRHPELGAYRQPPLTAVNQAYTSADEPLHQGDELAFIPPVAGG